MKLKDFSVMVKINSILYVYTIHLFLKEECSLLVWNNKKKFR